jgi:transcriptional regulator with XRE-family HTH domain
MFTTLLGSKILHYRALSGMSQEELGEKAKISKAYVSLIETGKRIPTFKLTIKLAQALQIDWRELAISPITQKIETLEISDKEKQKLNTIVNDINKNL